MSSCLAISASSFSRIPRLTKRTVTLLSSLIHLSSAFAANGTIAGGMNALSDRVKATDMYSSTIFFPFFLRTGVLQLCTNACPPFSISASKNSLMGPQASGDTTSSDLVAQCSAWKACVRGSPSAKYSTRPYTPPRYTIDTIPAPIPILTLRRTLADSTASYSSFFTSNPHCTARLVNVGTSSSVSGHTTMMASPANLKTSPPSAAIVLIRSSKYELRCCASFSSPPGPEPAIASHMAV
mmetsp:Transcript_10358/g.19610  ORF Transcript_10358/g.19610 Transcript_10358/m.19610 type:complete len:239 (-) Transcript_10358:163-879(-)